MKTSEQWLDEVTHHFDDGKVVRSLLKKDIEAIQLDAAKRGMEIAAVRADNYDGDGMDSKSYYDQGGNAAKTKSDIVKVILAARDSLTGEQL
jgi:hypothetical protein